MDISEIVSHERLSQLYIGGEWVFPATLSEIDVVSPSTEERIFSVPESSPADVDRAVRAARRAFDEGPWPQMSHAERAKYLTRFGEELRIRGKRLAHAWTRQMGATFRSTESVANDVSARFDAYAALATSFPFQEHHRPGNGVGDGLLVREPVGVVAGIVPWNAPLHTAVNKLAPALLAGCTFILKPSPETPLEAYVLAEVADAVGLPPGVFNFVTADRAASEHLVRNPGVDKVSFTGSAATGCHLASILGSRMARYTMELGGKSAAIILDDYDIETAATSITNSLCHLNGQVCAALTRVVVSRDRHDDLVDAFVARMGALRVGDPYDTSVDLGPLAMKRQLSRVEGYISAGKREGAKLATGGGRPAGLNRGFYVEPTVFAAVDNAMSIAQDEIFGPVICVIPADSEEQAVRIANDTKYGLNGAVMTYDRDRAYSIARKVRSGSFSQNNYRLDITIGFGGFKQSGVGREGGTEGLLPYLESKTILFDAQA